MVGKCGGIFQISVHLLFVKFLHSLFCRILCENRHGIVFFHSLLCAADHSLCFGKLTSGKFLNDTMGFWLGFFPVDSVVAKIIRVRGVAEYIVILHCKHGRLPHIGIVTGFQRFGIAVLIGRNVAFLCRNLFVKTFCTVPDGLQFAVIKRRIAFCRFFQIAGICFFRISKTLENFSCIA